MIKISLTKSLSLFLRLFYFIFIGKSSVGQTISFEPFATGFSDPVVIANDNQGNLYVGQNAGEIKIILPNGAILPFMDITNRINGNYSGIHGIAFDPNYTSNGFLYVKYVDGATLNCHISRFSRNPTNQYQALASSEVILLTYNNQVGHLGGNLEFNNDGYLYFTTGDGAPGGRTQPGDEYGNSQNMYSPKGKLMRIDVTNGVLSYPASNPHLINNDNIPDEIIGVGLRNPWKFSFDKSTGDLWLGDVGQDKYEEINFVPNGTFENTNFGWSCYEGYSPHILANCPPNVEFVTPAYVYNGYNFNGNTPVSVTGGYVYRGSQYSNLNGWYIFGDYATNDFWRTKRNPNGTFETIQLGKLIPNPVAFGQDNSGEIYVASYSNGNIYKLKSTCDQNRNLENIHNVNAIVKVSDNINSTAAVPPNVSVEYCAGKSISLMPGFEASHVGIFKAQITACN